MNSYGLTLEGNFIIEKVSVRPEFNSSQIGRFIFVESSETYWVGGLTGWLNFGLTAHIINNTHVSWGFSYGQINAKSIPFHDDVYNIFNATNVHDALIELMKGNGFANDCIVDRMIADRSICSNHINWGVATQVDDNGDILPDRYVGAEDIPIESLFRGNVSVTNVQSAINNLENNSPIILRKTIQPTSWEYAPAEELYRVMIPTAPISNVCSIVQCYDLSGKLLIPAKVIIDLMVNRIYIWMPYAMSLIVIIVG